MSAEEQAKAKAWHEKADHALRLVKVLGPAGFGPETRSNLLDGAMHLARALAVEHRLPEPASFDGALLPPFSHCWKGSLPTLRQFAADSDSPWQHALDHLEKL